MKWLALIVVIIVSTVVLVVYGAVKHHEQRMLAQTTLLLNWRDAERTVDAQEAAEEAFITYSQSPAAGLVFRTTEFACMPRHWQNATDEADFLKTFPEVAHTNCEPYRLIEEKEKQDIVAVKSWASKRAIVIP